MIAWHPEGRWSSDAEGLDGRYYADRIVGHFTAAAALLNLLVAVKLVDDSGYATGLEPGQRDVQAMSSLDAYIYGWRIGLVFFGVHLLLVGYVIVKSDYVPRILGRLVALAGLGRLAIRPTSSGASAMNPRRNPCGRQVEVQTCT